MADCGEGGKKVNDLNDFTKSYERVRHSAVFRHRRFLSYKRMEEKDVILDRVLFAVSFHFLQKNGGEGCHHYQQQQKLRQGSIWHDCLGETLRPEIRLDQSRFYPPT